jgi:hypothetical protein
MSRLVWLASVSGIAAVALLIAFRAPAAAGEAASCAPTDTFIPAFCVNVPTSSVRRETSVPLVSLPSHRADVRVEVGVPGSDAAALAAGVDRSVERIEALFGRTYSTRPRILVFASAPSFATGAKDLFGYSPATANYIASTYGGIFDRGTLTIAVNWGAAGSSRMNAAIAHELSHLMVRDITGTRDIPAWLDEGLATVMEQEAPGALAWNADEELTGRAVAASGAVTLAQVESLADFHSAYARLDRALYTFAADAVRTMRDRIGWDGVVSVLASIGRGQSFADAYRVAAGESVAAMEKRLDTSEPAIVVSTVADANGNVSWTLYAGRVSSAVQVSISGGAGYALTFTVRTDALGIYRGSFGSTAAPGTYTVRGAGAAATLVTTTR